MGHTIEVQPPTRGREGRTHSRSSTINTTSSSSKRVHMCVQVCVHSFELVPRQNRFALNSGSNMSKKWYSCTNLPYHNFNLDFLKPVYFPIQKDISKIMHSIPTFYIPFYSYFFALQSEWIFFFPQVSVTFYVWMLLGIFFKFSAISTEGTNEPFASNQVIDLCTLQVWGR